MFYVYIHTVPNGKIYIGQTSNCLKRWRDGDGYKDNEPFYKDILKYGWNNIKHEIISQFEDRASAERLESTLIAILQSENTNIGYNQTNIYESAMSQFASRISSDFVFFDDVPAEESFFEASKLPRSACEELIEQWIFNAKYRNIVKSRLLDGLSYKQLAETYGMSVRQLKRIVYESCDKLEEHLHKVI